jgi:peptidoglycan hydrolase-like protein with peptidoglycan-binding domain
VSTLQRALRACNFSGNLVVDGHFGPATKKAVTYAQYRRGIGQDGIYGPQSRRAFTWPTYWSNGKPKGTCVNTD